MVQWVEQIAEAQVGVHDSAADIVSKDSESTQGAGEYKPVVQVDR